MKLLNQGTWISRYLQTDPLAKFDEHLQQVYTTYYREHDHSFDYRAFAQSELFTQHKLISRAITTVDIASSEAGAERLSFWLNLYNALCIHIVTEEQLTGPLTGNKNVFSDYAYEIGNIPFTLDDIEHGILRGNSKPYGSFRRQFGDQDERRRLILAQQEPRIHFAMYSACASSPRKASMNTA